MFGNGHFLSGFNTPVQMIRNMLDSYDSKKIIYFCIGYSKNNKIKPYG
jgi:hypothetical protein